MISPRRRSVFTSRLRSSAAAGEQPRVLADLRHAILGGEEPPGTVIPIDAVAEVLGVSPIPVREALKTLVGEGLVDHVPRVGYSVAKLTFAEFTELYQVRQALELSALTAAVLQATPVDVEVARGHQRDLAAAVESGDDRAYHRASREFHRCLIDPAGMPRLTHMYDGAWNMTEPARPMSRVDPAHQSHFVAEHERMLTAYATRDVEVLLAEATAHYVHLRAAIESLRSDVELFRPAALG